MKKAFVCVLLGLFSLPAFANDGGIASIQVDQIKMQALTSEGEVARKIANPNFKITVKGGEAKKLQAILPSDITVMTAVYPELEKAYNESFKTLAVYSKGANGVTGKMLIISCSDAEMVHDEDGPKIVKTGKTECRITIEPSVAGLEEEMAGPLEPFEPKMCK